jgi:hypothetical protein
MVDLAFVGLALIFFVSSWGLLKLCESLKGGDS